MDIRSQDELNTLTKTLRHLLSVFSQKFPDLNFEFLPAHSLDDQTLGFKPVAEARIDFDHAGSLSLRIEQADAGEFRICLPCEEGETFNTCSHILLVPKGTESQLDMWRVDLKALKQTTRGRQFTENYKPFCLTTDDSIPAKVTIITGLIRSAISPLIQASLTNVIAHSLVATAISKRRKGLEWDNTL